MNTQNITAKGTLGEMPMQNEAEYEARSIHVDQWEAIEAQLNHWAEMDAEYWRQRKEREYKAWMKRTYGV